MARKIFISLIRCILGMYFSSGSSKRRLDYYLTFLQAYYWFKRVAWNDAFPPPLEHLYKDTLTSLRSKLKLCQSYEDAQTEVNNIRVQLGVGKIYRELNVLV